MNIYFGDMLPPGQDRGQGREYATAGDQQAPEGVLVGTASPLKVRVEEIEHHLAPEGTTCIGTFYRNQLISRCAVPGETAREFLSMELFDRPVSLALNVRPGGPGLEGSLLALVPLSQTERRGRGEDEDVPWKSSVPGSGYEEAAREIDEEEEGHLVGIFLGQVVRFDEDRQHPDNLVREAADMLAGVVRGRVGKLVDRVLEDLKEGPTGSPEAGESDFPPDGPLLGPGEPPSGGPELA